MIHLQAAPRHQELGALAANPNLEIDLHDCELEEVETSDIFGAQVPNRAGALVRSCEMPCTMSSLPVNSTGFENVRMS